MKFKTFQEFMKQHESSPWTRTRQNALLGIGPDVPEAGLNSRSTADPRLVDYSKKRKKKKKKKKKLSESKTDHAINKDIDRWLNSVDGLKRDLDKLPDEEETPTDDVPDSDLPDDVDADDDLDGEDEDEEGEEGEEDLDAAEAPESDEDLNANDGPPVDPAQVSPTPIGPQPKPKSFKDWAKEKEQPQQ